MKKALKILCYVAAAGMVVLLSLALTLPMWLGPAATSLANAIVPRYTQTAFKIDRVSINPYTGRFAIHELHLANPQGYAAKEAFSVATVRVDVAVGALFGKVLHFRNIEILSPYVSYLGHKGINNFDAILASVQSKMNMQEQEEAEEKPQEPEAPAEKSGGMRVKIDRFHLAGVSFQMGPMPFAIPLGAPITLTDLGSSPDGADKNAQGVTFSEMGSILADECQKVFAKAGSGFLKGLGSGVNLLKTEAASGSGAALKSLGAGASAAGDAAGDAAKRVGEGAKNLLKGAGGLFGGDK